MVQDWRRTVNEALVREVGAWGQFVRWSAVNPTLLHRVWPEVHEAHLAARRAYGAWRPGQGSLEAGAFVEASDRLVVLVARVLGAP